MGISKLLVNVSGGEIDPLTYSRVDVPLYAKSVKKCENFNVLPQGGFKFRNGTQFVRTSRTNSPHFLYSFQFSDQQAYVIEATDSWFRFYTQNGIVLNKSALNITGYVVTSSITCTAAAHGMVAGAEIFASGLSGNGWDALNGQFVAVTIIDANTFSFPNIYNISGSPSVGSLTPIYEIPTPYLLADLPYLQFAQIADTAYITNNNYEPRKLQRLGNSSWTLATYTRTTDPFPSGIATISGITQAKPAVITTAAAHGFTSGETVTLQAIVGMTQLNNRQFQLTVVDTTHFSIADLSGNAIDSTGYTAYASAGTAQPSRWPRACAFTDSGRLLFAGLPIQPMSCWASAAPTTAATRYDVFTGGTLATDAFVFTLAPVHGISDSIQWVTSTSNFIVIGTYGTIRTLYGSDPSQPATPTNISAKSINTFGSVNSQPISNGSNLFYLQRGGLLLRSIEYSYQTAGYISIDRNLVSTHLTPNGFKLCVEQQGQPDLIWVVRYDGIPLTLTYKDAENVSGWARHYLGGRSLNTKNITVPFGKVTSCARMLRNQSNSLYAGGDQIWFGVERVINGSVVRSVEFLTDAPVYPIRENFNSVTPQQGSVAAVKANDDQRWQNAMFESMKTMCHLDMSSSYDGSQLGLAAGAALTPSAISGTGVAITSSAAVFTAAMVGRQIWKQYDINGNGGGRAVITAFTSSTQVTVSVLQGSPFDNLNPMAAGNWYLTAKTISGLSVWNGETLSVTADGGYLGTFLVANGSITMPDQASDVTIGYPYVGTLQTLNANIDTQTGSGEAKTRSLHSAAINCVNTLGILYGTNLYKGMDRIIFRSTADSTGRPSPLFSGIKKQTFTDSYSGTNTNVEKNILIVQPYPLPATITGIDMTMTVADA